MAEDRTMESFALVVAILALGGIVFVAVSFAVQRSGWGMMGGGGMHDGQGPADGPGGNGGAGFSSGPSWPSARSRKRRSHGCSTSLSRRGSSFASEAG